MIFRIIRTPKHPKFQSSKQIIERMKPKQKQSKRLRKGSKKQSKENTKKDLATWSFSGWQLKRFDLVWRVEWRKFRLSTALRLVWLPADLPEISTELTITLRSAKVKNRPSAQRARFEPMGIPMGKFAPKQTNRK